MLRPAIPSAEIFGVDSTYGPRANFKIALRELPDHGRFRVTVTAAKYNDGLLLDPARSAQPRDGGNVIVCRDTKTPRTITVKQAGIYQVDVYTTHKGKPPELTLSLGERQFTNTLKQPAFLVVRLPAGTLAVNARFPGGVPLDRIVFTPLAESQEIARRFIEFEKRSPLLGVHLGFRRDCGSTLAPVGATQTVSSEKLSRYVFEGSIRNFPNPDVEKDNVNYLAGVREIGVRSEYTDGRDMPRLLIRSVEFEGPFHETWPPPSHRNIFLDSDRKDDPAAYGQKIIREFATRAFRRPITIQEENTLMAVFKNSRERGASFQKSVKDALQVVADLAAVPVPDREQPHARSRTARRLRTGVEAVLLPVERPAGRDDPEAGRSRFTAKEAGCRSGTDDSRSTSSDGSSPNSPRNGWPSTSFRCSNRTAHASRNSRATPAPNCGRSRCNSFST